MGTANAGWSYNQADVIAAAARPQLTEGLYQWVVDFASTKVDEDGNLNLSARVSPVLQATGHAPLPLRNPDTENFPDHTPPEAWRFAILAEAIFPDECPGKPIKVDGVWMYNGEEIDAEDVEEKRQEASQAVFDMAVKLAEDTSLLKDSTFYGICKTNGDYQNVNRPMAKLPDDAQLVPDDSFKAGPKTTAPVAKTTPAKSNGTAKPASASKTAAKGKK
jgi:hypothetical protein